MMDKYEKSTVGGLSRDAWESCLPAIADKIAETFFKSQRMRQTIQKYAIRQGAFHILTENKEDQGHGTDRSGLSREIMSLLADFLTGEVMDLYLFEAIRDRDVSRIKRFFTEKCRSALADGARDPRFRALRTIVCNAASENLLNYRRGQGLYSKKGEEWACYAFSNDKELEVIRNQQDFENYGTWPLPPLMENFHQEEVDSKLTQKEVVLETARFFWNETVRRHGPGMVFLLELKRYMEKRFPPWLMTYFLPDPLADSATFDGPWDPKNDRRNTDPASDSNVPSTSALWVNGHDNPGMEDQNMHKTALDLATNWLIGLKEKKAAIFCMRYHCEYSLIKIAGKVGLGSPQLVSYHYEYCIQHLKDYCTRQEELSAPDEAPVLAELFFETLRDVCTKEILKGGCE
jgi:hypothetical protein